MRWLYAPHLRADPVLHLAQAAAAGPPWLAITLSVIALVTAVGVAYMPVVLERAKQRHANQTPQAPTTPPAIEASVDLVGAAFVDIRTERDEAQDEVKRLNDELTSVRVALARAEAQIVALERDRIGRDSA